MGWITFEDGIAYSRNVVAAKVALGLGRHDARSRPRCSTTRGGRSASGRRPASTSPARRPASTTSAIRRVKPWSQIDLANGAFGQGVAVTPIQLATAYAALVNGGTRVQPHVVERRRVARHHRRRRAAAWCPTKISPDPAPDDGPRRRGGAVLPRPDARARLPRRRQDRHGPDLGRARRRPGSTTSSTTRSSDTSAARPARPISSSRSASRRAGRDRAPRPPGDAGHVVRAVPAHRDRRDHDARPAPAPARSPSRCPSRTGERALCDTGRRERRRPVERGRRPTPRPRSRPTISSATTGGRLLARSDRPDPRRRRRLASGRPRAAVRRAARASGPTAISILPEAVERGAGALLVTRQVEDAARIRRRHRSCGWRTGWRRSGAVAAGWRRRFDPLVVGITGSIAKTSTKEAVATVLGGEAPDPQDRGQPEQRDRPAADADAARPGARGGGARDGDVRLGRDRRPGGDGAAVDRRRDGGPAGPPLADRHARGDRAGQG